MNSTWNEHGWYLASLLDDEEILNGRKELDRLFLNTDRTIIRNLHLKSKYFNDLMKNKKIINLVEEFIEDKVDALQTWSYLKPPGELGRDIHQNVFYTKTEPNGILNISISFDEEIKSNGCLFVYDKSHILDELPINIDEERLITNQIGWSNERGSACVMPKNYNFKKVYIERKAGSCMFIHSHLVHGSDSNLSKSRFRRSFLVGYIKRGIYFRSGHSMKREVINVY